ncbi:MAG TPA: hypothetical protein VK492_15480 [Chitinophagaceae bacterium]|nr:hypothetical protein [Chitinophagaceae bacterium]
MTQRTTKPGKFLILLPVIGCVLFIILYIVAALLYPGGSETDKTSIGYNWMKNYWCNLLNNTAINGQLNTAKPVATTAMIILCISISFFWILFPISVQLKKYHRIIIQIGGTASMMASFLLLTNIDHDLAVNFSSSLGFVAMLGVLVALYQLKWVSLFIFGFFNLLLVTLNNYLYYIISDLTYLPIVQKLTFLSFLFWICCIGMKMYLRIKTRN